MIDKYSKKVSTLALTPVRKPIYIKLLGLFTFRFGTLRLIVSFCVFLCAVFARMISSLRHCPGVAGSVSSHFLPAMDKNPRSLFFSCRVKE